MIRSLESLSLGRWLAVGDLELGVRVSRPFGWDEHWSMGGIGGIRDIGEGRAARRHGALGCLRRGGYGYSSHG